LGWTVFGIEWGLAILAIVFTAIDLKKYEVFSMTCYIAMGWLVVLFTKQAIIALGQQGLMLLLAGGILYTIGAVVYGLGKKRKYMHGVFHIFVLLGSLLHYLCIIFYAL
jgi:hemolysin III